MTGIAPVEPPNAARYLAQRAERLRLAVREISAEFKSIEARIKEVQNDLILVLSALDELEGQPTNGESLP